MNSDIKTKWLEALRSGDYRQGQNVLHQQFGGDKPQYCCLGVLCDIAVKDGVISAPEIVQGDQDGYHVYEYAGAEEVLPKAVREWAGISESNPTFQDPDEDYTVKTSVADLNDGGKTFTQLADLIEEHL